MLLETDEGELSPRRVAEVVRIAMTRHVFWFAAALPTAGIFHFAVRAPLWPLVVAVVASVAALVDIAVAPRVPLTPARRYTETALDFAAVAAFLWLGPSALTPLLLLLLLPICEAYALFGRGSSRTVAWGGAAAALGCALAVSMIPSADTTAWLLRLAALPPVLISGLFVGLALRPTEGQPQTLLATRTVEDVEQQVTELEEQGRQLRASYREVAVAARDAQAARDDEALKVRLLSAAIDASGEKDAAASEEVFSPILKELAERFGAGGGALWVRDPRTDRLEVRAVRGAVSPFIREEPVPAQADSPASEVRKACEEQLRRAAPIPNEPTAETEDNALPEGDITGEDRVAAPVILATALRISGEIVGAVALCSPAAFDSEAFEPEMQARLAGLENAAALSIHAITERSRLTTRLREISVVHELSGLVASAMESEQLSERIVDSVVRAIPCENCTLFGFEADQTHLTPRATRGRVVNLIDHIPFEHGGGVSGWVAQQRKQLFIPDLSKEPGLLNVALIPPRVRSFVSVPIFTEEHLLGVLNISDSRANAFSVEDARLLALLASQAAAAMERREQLRSLEQMAITDGLTRLYNHRYFQMRLGNEVKRAQRYGLGLGLLMIDLDHFKQINDRYGHGAGDVVLAEVARVLRRSIRETDIAARYGGEELAVILLQASPADARTTAERLRQRLGEHPYAAGEGVVIPLTVSIGAAVLPRDADTAEALLKRADAALYAAKSGGRDRVCEADAAE